MGRLQNSEVQEGAKQCVLYTTGPVYSQPQQLWAPAQDQNSQHPSTDVERVHEPSSLTEELLTVDCFWGRKSQSPQTPGRLASLQ